jgi:hypothetical protein
MVVLLVCGVATINALAFYANDLQPYVGTAGVESFSLQGPGTLAAWCGALLMAVSAATCCQVYCLRKHRCDDYLGSYRVWSWLAVLFAVGSLSQSVDMVGIVSALIAAAAGAANLILPTVGGAPLMTLVGGLLFSIVAAICCWEVRRSRGSLILAATAWAAGMVAIAVTVPALNDRIAAAQLEPAFANGWLLFLGRRNVRASRLPRG